MPEMIEQSNFPLGSQMEKVLSSQSILDVFVLQEILDSRDAETLKDHFKTNREVEEFLIKNHLVTRDTVNKAYSIILKLPFVSLANFNIPDDVLGIVPMKLAEKYHIIPFGLSNRMLKLAIARPADLLVHYPEALERFFRENDYFLELFVTGEEDFRTALTQYDKRAKRKLLLSKASLPVVYLRNQTIPDNYLKKLPKEFIEKYRLVIFGQNASGEYLVGCENPDSSLNKKIVDFLERENGIKTELFATSKADIDYVLILYVSKATNRPKLDLGIQKIDQELPEESPVEKKGSKARFPQASDPNDRKITLQGLLDALIGDKEPEFTIDDRPDFDKFSSEVKTDPLEPGVSVGAMQPAQPVAPTKAASPEQPVQPDTAQQAETKVDIKPEVAHTPALPKQAVSLPEIEKGQNDIVSAQPKKNNLEETNISALLGGREIIDVKALEDVIKEGYVPKMLAALVNFAIHEKASDIHIEPGARQLRVRFRIDGILRDVVRIALSFQPPLVSRVKILSLLKIDESRTPQDGRFDVICQNHEVDVRVSLLPTVNGEKIVLRLLDKNQGILSLEDLGMQGSAFKNTVTAIEKPYGVILSTGPTGSGKSTTLYAIINRLSVPGVNIVTLEDPVEYEIPGINQCQVKPEIGFTFASGLRSVLRQDPNVIMVGEVRDTETANMATHAALTGHLVLSTLHTNDTAGALPRLIDMGVEPFLITSSMNLIIAQRLVRRICLKCREEMKVPQRLVDEIKKEIDLISKSNNADLSMVPKELKFFYGRGCPACNQGYLGRIGIFEVMEMTPEIEDLGVNKRPANDIKATAVANGMITLKQDGIIKVLQGITTIDEVFQATMGV